MTHPSLRRFPLETLLGFSHDGRAFRSFDHLIFSQVGTLLLVPVWRACGDLRRVVDGCPVPWEEVWDVLDAPADASTGGEPALPASLQVLAVDGWQQQLFRLARRETMARRFVHTSGIRFADL